MNTSDAVEPWPRLGRQSEEPAWVGSGGDLGQIGEMDEGLVVKQAKLSGFDPTSRQNTGLCEQVILAILRVG